MKQLTERPVNDVHSTTRTVTATSELHWLLAFLVFAREENPFPLDRTTHTHTLLCSKKSDAWFQKYHLFVSEGKLFESANHVTSKRYSISNWWSDSYGILLSLQPDCHLSPFLCAFFICFFFIFPKQQSAPLVSIYDRSYCFNVALSSAVYIYIWVFC